MLVTNTISVELGGSTTGNVWFDEGLNPVIQGWD